MPTVQSHPPQRKASIATTDTITPTTNTSISRNLGSWLLLLIPDTHTDTRLMAIFSGTTHVSRYQKGKTNLDFTEARDSEWQWHQLGHMQVCTSLQTDNHASTPPLSFLQAGCPSCHLTNSVKALKTHKTDKYLDTLLAGCSCCSYLPGRRRHRSLPKSQSQDNGLPELLLA